MTPATLRSHSYKDLAQMAKKRGVPGWHSMRKDQLVTALMKDNGKPSSKSKSQVTVRSSVAKAPVKPTAKSAARSAKPAPISRASAIVRQRISQLQARLESAKNLAGSLTSTNGEYTEPKDRLVVMVRDPYWLHVHWELTRQSVQRAQAAMGQRWHTAKPILRLYEVHNVGDSTTTDTCLRDVEIHGGVNNWYLDVLEPPKSYRIEIGYVATDGGFYSLTRSNIVTTPSATARDKVDGNWADVAENFDRIYAMSGGYAQEGNSHELRELLEERLRRPMGSPATTRFGAGAGGLMAPSTDFHLHADAELVIFGATRSDAHVMLKGEPVQVRPDGTFAVRISLPDCRQVIPVVASSADGVEQRTIALAIERNTKQMETVIHDSSN
jgi:uncharacterized protein